MDFNFVVKVAWEKLQCCCSVAQSCPTLSNSTDCSMSGFPVSSTISWSLLKLTSIELVMPSNHLVLCLPLLLLPSVFLSIRVFSNQSALRIRWPKYWSFSFSISPFNEYSGLISFRFDLVWSPCYPRDSQESSPAPQFKSINSSVLSFLMVQLSHPYWLLKNQSFDEMEFYLYV